MNLRQRSGLWRQKEKRAITARDSNEMSLRIVDRGLSNSFEGHRDHELLTTRDILLPPV